MTKRNIPLFKVHMPSTVIDSLKEVINSGVINEGLQVAEFEKKIQQLIGNPLTMATNSCTSSLTLALHLIGVGPGDEVVSSPVTCVATNAPVKNRFAKPIWCDVNPLNGTIDPISIREKLTERTKAILCIDWAGIPADLDQIKAIGQERGIKVVEDAAQAFGAVYKGKPVGSVSDFTAFSFQAIKHITTGDGGALSCLDQDDYKRGKRLKWLGIDREETQNSTGDWRGSRWNCSIDEAGYKMHMNNIDAAIGIEQCKHADAILKAHRKNAAYYIESLTDVKGITLPDIQEGSLPAWWGFMFFAERRDDLARKLSDYGIHSSLLHSRNDAYECFGSQQAELPGVAKFYNFELCIPCGWWVSGDDAKYIVDVIKDGW